MDLLKVCLILIGVMSLITFITYGADKLKAKRRSWRIPEKVLLSLSFFGGALGGLFAMTFFRHKTQHWYFYFVNIASLILHVIICILPLFHVV